MILLFFLYYIILYYITLYYIVLYYIILYYIILYYIILYYIILYNRYQKVSQKHKTQCARLHTGMKICFHTLHSVFLSLRRLALVSCRLSPEQVKR